MKILGSFCKVMAVWSLLIHSADAGCSSGNCDDVEVTDLRGGLWSDAQPTIPVEFFIDGYNLPTSANPSGETGSNAKPPIKVKKNKEFEIKITPFKWVADPPSVPEDVNVWGIGGLEMTLGCGTSKVRINGKLMKFTDGASGSNDIDLSTTDVVSRAYLWKQGCETTLTITYDGTGEMDLTVEVVDPDALSGCPSEDYGTAEDDEFSGSADGSGANASSAPAWRSQSPEDAVDLDNWVYEGGEWQHMNSGHTHWQVLTGDALYDLQESGGVEIRTYNLDQLGPLVGGFYDQTGKTVAEYVSYTVVSGKLQVVVERDAVPVVVKELQNESLGGTPAVSRKTITDLISGKRQVFTSTAPSGTTGEEIKSVVTETWQGYGTNFNLVSREKTTLQNSEEGYRVIESVIDPTYAGRVDPANLVTKSFYTEDGVVLATYPDGAWMVKTTSFLLLLPDGTPDPNISTIEGLLPGLCSSVTYRPFLDSSLTGTFPDVELPDLEECTAQVELYGYFDPSGGSDATDVSITATITGGRVTARKDRWKRYVGTGPTGYMIEYVRVYDSAGNHRKNETWFPDPDGDEFGGEAPGRLARKVNADGTATALTYAEGDYVPGGDVDPFEGEVDEEDVYFQITETDIGDVLTVDPALAKRVVTIRDYLGRLVERRTEARLSGGSYETMTTDTWVYEEDLNGRTILTERYTDGLLRDREAKGTGFSTTAQSAGGPLVTTVEDGSGRVVSLTEQVTGRPDMVTSYGYQGLAETVTTTAGGLSRSSSTIRDIAGRLSSQTSEEGIIWSYSYGDGGRTVTVTKPGGITETTSRYKDGRLKSVTGTGVVAGYTHYLVETTGFVSTKEYVGEDSGPRFVTTTRDWSGRTVAVSRPSPTESGNVTESRVYDANGRLVTIDFGTSAADRKFTYDSMGNVRLSGLDLDGGGLSLASTDRVTETRRGYEKSGGIWWDVTMFKSYRTNGNGTDAYASVEKNAMAPVEEEGAVRWTSVKVMPGGQTITEHHDENFTDQTVVDTSDSSSTSASPDERTVSLGGLVISSSQYGVDHPSSYEYDALGRMTAVTGPRGGVVRTEYDSSGRRWRVTNHFNDTTLYQYYGSGHQNAGMLWKVTDPEGGTTTSVYDGLGRLTETGGTGAYPVKYTYNVYGDLLTHSTTRNGSAWDITTWSRQDGTGLPSGKVYPGGNKTEYRYHDHGGMNVRTWERGVTTTYSYNGALDVTGINYSDSTPDVSFTPDRLGRPLTITDGGGTLTRAYHSSLPVTETDTYASGHSQLPGVVLTHTWDADDVRRTAVGVDWSGGSYSTAAAYDPVTGLVAGYTGSNTFKHEYAYVPGTSLISGINHLSGATARGTETRLTDLAGRLYGIQTKNAAGTTITRNGYMMDNAGRRTKSTRENAEYWEYSYNDRGEVVSGKKHLPDGGFLAGHQFEYEYDLIGNRTLSKAGGNAGGTSLRAFGYTPDARNQYDTLTYPVPATFDVIGRSPVATGDSITSTTGTVTRQGEHYRLEGTASNATDADWKAVDVTYTPAVGAPSVQNGHVYVPEHEVTPQYDEDGNLTGDGRWSYVWDAENRLVSMTSLHNDKPRTRVIEFAYDWMGRRVAKQVTDEISSVMTVTDKRRFAYDGWNMVAEFSVGGGGSLVPERQYTWGLDLSGTEQGAGGVGGLLSAADQGTPYVACYGGNGDVIAWLDSSGGIAGRREYDPFGSAIVHEGVFLPFGFSTKYADAESGLLYYGYRYYDPAAGRWTNRDPIGERGGVNLYGFVGNDGVNSLDKLGMLKLSLGDTVTTRNLTPGKRVDIVPGIPPIPGTVPGNSLGFTMLKYKLSSECQVNKDGKFCLKEYTVEVYSEVILRKEYETKDLEDFATYSEQQHVKDYTNWANSEEVKETMEKIESKISIKKFKDEKECKEQTIILFLQNDLLKRKAKDANVKTRKKYDDGDSSGNPPLHTYPGKGKWGDGVRR